MEVLQQCYHSISALSLNSLFDSSFNCRTYTFPPAYSFTLELLHWLCRIESRADAWLSWSATNIEVSSWLARTSELLWGALVHFGQWRFTPNMHPKVKGTSETAALSCSHLFLGIALFWAQAQARASWRQSDNLHSPWWSQGMRDLVRFFHI